MCDADQFVEVVEAGQVLWITGGFELTAVARTVEHRLDQLPELVAQPPRRPSSNSDERGDGLLRAGVQHRNLARRRGLEGVVEAGAGVLGVHRDARLSPVADAAPRGVEDAPHAHRVAGIVQHPQVGDDVADLPALVEPNAANDFVRYARADEDLFQRARRVVGAVEHRDVVVRDVAAVGQRVDLLGDEASLVVLVVGDVADDEFALAGVGPQPLLTASGVARDDRVGRRQDVLRRPVILFQQNRRRVRVVALEVLDVADGRAAERVDGLVGITDDAQFGGRDVTVLARSCPTSSRTSMYWAWLVSWYSSTRMCRNRRR